MSSIFCEVSKYLMIIFFALYTWSCFSVFKRKDKERQKAIFRRQNLLMFLFHLDGYMVLYDQTENLQVLLFYGAQVIFFLIVISSYKLLYEQSAQLLVNNMCMLMSIGFLILTRLSYEKAIKQFTIAVGSMILALGIPFLIQKIRFIRKMTWLYAGVGLLALAVVAVLGAASYGAKISFTIFGITIQPSEFVKIIFVFFVAGMFHQSREFKQVVITTVAAAAQVIILVASKDLGGALIFFVVYIVMLYVATGNPFYFIGEIGRAHV